MNTSTAHNEIRMSKKGRNRQLRKRLRQNRAGLRLEALEERRLLAIDLQNQVLSGLFNDQAGTAIAYDSGSLYVAGNDTTSGYGFAQQYNAAVAPPALVTTQNLVTTTSLTAISALGADVDAVGNALPPACGATDGVGGTEIKSLLAQYSTTPLTNVGCQSANLFPYTGGEYYLGNLLVNESGTPYDYATGGAQANGANNTAVLLKYDMAGTVQWRTDLGNTGSFNNSNGRDIAVLNGNEFVAGYTHYPYTTASAIRTALWKVSPAGGIAAGFPKQDIQGMFNGITAFGGSLYAVGTYSTGVAGQEQYTLAKYDDTGALLWSNTLGGSSDDELLDVVGLGSKLYAVGNTQSQGAGGRDAIILEIDPGTGTVLSSTLFGGAQDDVATGIATDGTSLFVVGDTRSFTVGSNGAGQDDLMLLRYTPSAAPVSVSVLGGDLLVSDTGGGVDSTLKIVRSGANIRITDPTSTLALAAGAGATQVDAYTVDVPLAGVSGSIRANTLGGRDSLTIDYGSGDPLPAGGVVYNGGSPTVAPGDSLTIQGGTFTTVTSNLTNANSGSVNLDGKVVSYTGLEPVLLNVGTAANMVFNLPAGADDAYLEDDGTSGNNLSQLRANTGTFEVTTFTHPTTSLTINGGSGDAVTIALVDSLTAANLTVSGVATINVGNLATSGNVSLSASGAIAEQGSDAGVDVAAGTLTLSAGTGIGSGNAVETQVTTIDATNSASGDIQLTEADGINVNRLAQSGGGNVLLSTVAGSIVVVALQSGVTATSGTTNLTAGGSASSLTVNRAIASSSGAIQLWADDDVAFSAAGDVTSTSGSISVIADHDNGGVASGALTMANGTILNAGSGTVLLSANEDIAIGSVQTTSSSTTAVSITSTAGGVTDAGDTDVDIVANSGTVVIDAVTGVGTGNALETTIGTIDADNATSGNIQLTETNALVINKVAQATAGNIAITSNGGTVTVAAGQSGVSAVGAGTIFLFADGGSGDLAVNAPITSATGGITLQADRDVTLAAAGDVTSTSGNVVVTADADNGAGLSGALTMTDGAVINAGSGTITLSSDGDLAIASVQTTSALGTAVSITVKQGSLLDGGDSDPDIVANSGTATITASVGIGTSGNAIDTSVLTLVATASAGSVNVAESDGLTLQSVTASGSGNNVAITNATGTINVTSVTAANNVTLTATESAGTDNISLSGTATVTATAGTVLLRAGDDASLPAGSRVVAGTTATVTIDFGSSDANGGTLTFAGDIDAPSATFQGESAVAQNDTFNVTPDQDNGTSSTPIAVNGFNPTAAPGDTLNLTITGLTSPALTVAGVNNGQWAFGNAASVAYTSIETVNTTPSGTPYDLILDMEPTLTSLDLNADTIDVRRNAPNLEIRVDGSLVFVGSDADIKSLQVLGGNSTAGGNVPDDTLVITETASGLPAFAGTSVAPGSHVSSTFTSLTGYNNSTVPVKIHYDGRGGVNSLTYALLSSHGVVYTSDNADTSKSGDVGVASDGTFASPQLGLSFENLAPLTISGAGGSLVVDASSSPSADVTSLTVIGSGIDPIAGLNAGTSTDGASIVYPNAGSATFEPTLFSGFGAVTIRSGSGGDSIDLRSVDGAVPASPAGAAALTAVTLDADNVSNADNSSDTVTVRSLPGTVTATLLGGQGDDTFRIYDDQGTGSTADDTVDAILGQVVIASAATDEGGNDTLAVRDFGDATGDTVSVTATTIDGIFDSGTGTDITYNDNIDILTVDTGSGADTYQLNFGGTSNDLDSVTLSGNGGADSFLIQSSSAAAANTQLFGNAGSDLFQFAAGAFVLRGGIDGGSQNDLLDYANYSSARTINLTGLGATDGYTGVDATVGTSSLVSSPGTFTNIDAVRGTSFSDTLRQNANLRTHWDLGGNVAGFGPYGAASVNLANSLADSGVLVSDESDISLTGNASVVGRPTGANPIGPSGGEQDLAWNSFENLVGAATASDWFDLRNGASLSGTIDGRGGNDSLDYRDFSTAVSVNLPTGTATNIFGGAAGGLVAGTGGASDGNSIENVFGGDANDTINGDQDNNILGDGFGSDTLDGAAGDDTFQLEPGASVGGVGASNDVITDITGSDTVDFRFAGAGVTIDMDLKNVTQDVLLGVAGLQNVTLQQTGAQTPLMSSPFESVVGSQFNDVFHVDVLSADGNIPTLGVPVFRFVDGNNPPGGSDPIPPGDSLDFDGFGQPVFDTGAVLRINGMGSIYYQSIESLTIYNDQPHVVDNGDVDFQSLAGPYAWSTHEQSASGYGGDALTTYDSVSTNGARWTFHGVQPGTYRISTTFPLDPDQLAAVPFRVFDDTRLVTSVNVDQKTPPNDYQQFGASWEQLGNFPVTSHTLIVELDDPNLAGKYLAADAVRIERLSVNLPAADRPELRVQDGSSYVTDYIGSVPFNTTIGTDLQKVITVTNEAPAGGANLVITAVDLAGATGYTMNVAGGLPLTLNPGDSAPIVITLSGANYGEFQGELRIFANDPDETVQVTEGTGVDPSNNINPFTGAAYAPTAQDYDPFTFKLAGRVSNSLVIDDAAGAASFSLAGGWTPSNTSGFASGNRTSAADGSGDYAQWTSPVLPAGTYRVSATWAPSTANATGAKYAVNGVTVGASFDQTAAPNDLTADGGVWEDLYTTGAPLILGAPTAVSVQLLDSPAQAGRVVQADAIRIEKLSDIDVKVSVSGGPADLADDTGVVDFGSTDIGATVSKTFSITNNGVLPLTLGTTITVPAGFELTSDTGETTLAPAATRTFVLRYNAGGLGTISGIVSFSTTDHDENPFNFTVSGTVAVVRVIDDGDPGYSQTGTWSTDIVGNQGDSRRHSPGTGANTATWTFTGLAAGYYQVSATWPEKIWENTATANYVVTGSDGPQAATVDQRYAPNDRTDGGTQWEDLGLPIRVASAGGSITVTLSDSQAANLAVADAIRIERMVDTEMVMLDVTGGGVPLVDGASRIDLGTTTVGGPALNRTIEIRNYGATPLPIGTLQLPNGYTLVSAPASRLPAASGAGYSSTSFTVRLPSTVAGPFIGDVTLFSGDYNESPMSFTLDGDVVGTNSSFTYIATPRTWAAAVAQAPLDVPGGYLATLRSAAENAAAFAATGGANAWIGATDSAVEGTWVWATGPDAGVQFWSGGPGGTTVGGEYANWNPGEPNNLGNEDCAHLVSASPWNDLACGSTLGYVVEAQIARIVDDGDAGYAQAGNWIQSVPGFQGDQRQLPSNAGPATATWTFSGLTPNSLYRVSTHWQTIDAATTVAPFSVYDGSVAPGNLLGSVLINQTAAPDDYSANGTTWEDLGGAYRVGPSGTLIVQLGTAASGVMLADAVRLDPSNSPEIQVVDNSTSQNVADGSGPISLGSVIVGGSVARTFTIRNLGTTALSVGTPVLPHGYTLTTAPVASVAAGSSTTFTVTLSSSNGPGDYTGDVVFANGDSDENQFNFRISTQVLPPSALIDDGDASYGDTGGFTVQTPGYLTDQRTSAAGAGQTATWTFNLASLGLPAAPGVVYRVSATWAAAGNLATNSPFTVNGSAPITLNQQLAPNDYYQSGAAWEDLGYFAVPAGVITVQLADTPADGRVAADAIRIEQITTPEIDVRQGTTGLTDALSSVDFGATPVGMAVTKTYTVTNLGAGTLTLTNPTLPTGFTLTTPLSSTSLTHGQSATFTVQLDALAGGSYGGTLVLGNNDSDESPFEIALVGTVTTGNAAPIIMDDGDAGYAASATFTYQTGSGYGGDTHLALANAGGTSTWSFSGLATGLYSVAVSWPTGPSPAATYRAPNATYTLTYGASSKTLTVDQRQAPNDYSADGYFWEEFVGTVNYTGGVFQVSLPSTASSGYVTADAVRLVPLATPEIQVSVSGTNTTAGATTLGYPTTFIRDAAPTKTLVIENVGAGNLTLPTAAALASALPAGFLVSSDSGETSLATGATRTVVVRMATDPVGDSALPGSKSGTLSIANNDADEGAYSLNLAGYVESVMIVDQAQPTFYTSGRSASYSSTSGYRTTSLGYLGQTQYTTLSASNTATFTLTGLPAGVYQVSTTYAARTAWATNSPFTVNGGGVITINQQVAPASVVNESINGQTASWQHLGAPVTVGAGGSVTVVVGGVAANKYVAADAIRVQWLSPQEADAAPPLSVESLGQSITSSDVAPLVTEALRRWSEVDPLAAAQLSQLQVRVMPLPAGILGLAGSTTQEIWLSSNAAGHGWFVDPTPQFDDEFSAGTSKPVGYDLLSTVTHELGHLLGRGDLGREGHAEDVMAGELSVGSRRMPSAGQSLDLLPKPGLSTSPLAGLTSDLSRPATLAQGSGSSASASSRDALFTDIGLSDWLIADGTPASSTEGSASVKRRARRSDEERGNAQEQVFAAWDHA